VLLGSEDPTLVAGFDRLYAIFFYGAPRKYHATARNGVRYMVYVPRSLKKMDYLSRDILL